MRTGLWGLGISLLAGIASCNALLGLDGYFDAGSGGSAPSTSSTTTTSATGGVGGMTGSGSISGSDAGEGGMAETRGLGIWAVSLGGTNATVAGMDVDSVGNVYVTGSFKDALTLDGTPATGTGGSGGSTATTPELNCPTLYGPDKNTVLGYVLKLDPMGKCLWATGFGSAGGVGVVTAGTAIAVAPNGAVTLAGSYNKALPAGITPSLGAPMGIDAFVLRLPSDYAPVGGIPTWFHHIGDAGDQEVLSLALDGNNVYAGGRFTTSAKSISPSLGLNLQNAFPSRTGFVALFDGTVGNVVMAKTISNTTADVAVTNVAPGGSGIFAATGIAMGSVDNCNGTAPYMGGTDAFFGKYASNLACVFGGWLSAGGDQFAHRAIFSPVGDLYVAGSFAGTVDFQNGMTLTSATQTAFLAHIDAGGTTQKVISFGTMDPALALAGMRLSVAGNGDIVFAAPMPGDVDVLGKKHAEPAKAGDNVVVGRIDGGLMTTQWLHSYGTDAVEGADAVAVVNDGIVIAGHFNKSLDLGNGKNVVSGLSNDVFIAKLTP